MCVRAARHSLSSLKEKSNSSPKTKSPVSAKGNGNGTAKSRELRSKETTKAVVPCKPPDETEKSADVKVQP